MNAITCEHRGLGTGVGALATPYRRVDRTGYHLTVANRIADLNPRVWDQLTSTASLFLQRPYLQAFEAARPVNLLPRYALVRHGREVLAAMVAQWTAVTAAQFLPPPQTIAARLATALLGRLRVRLLVCGNVLASGRPGAAFAADLSPTARWQAVTQGLVQLQRMAGRDERATLLVIKDLAGSTGDEALLQSRFRPVQTEPDMVLTLADHWRTVDDYLASLKSRYARAARRVARQVAASGCRVERLADLEGNAARLHALYLQAHRAATLRLAATPAAYLPALAAALGPRLRCSVIHKEGIIMGFVTVLRDGEDAIGHYLGYDRGMAAQLPLYPRLLHAAIDDALALGCRRLRLGRTALDAKARLGALPRPMWVGVRGTGPVTSWFASLLEMMRPVATPQRRPFRATATAGEP